MNQNAIRLLLVEDCENDVLLAQETLRESGLSNPVEVARNGDEAMSFLKSWRLKEGETPILILLDINMPGMDGFEILHEIKADPKLWHLPVVMLTTSDAQLDIVKAYSRGVCTYLQKPLTLDKLRKVAQFFDLGASLQFDPAGSSDAS